MNPNEETLTELPDIENRIEKPKRCASQKQLDALSQAREKRKTKKTALDNVEPIAKKPAEPEPTIKKKTAKKAVKPTIIQIESGSDSDSSTDDEPPTVIIRRKNNKIAPAPIPIPIKPPAPEPIKKLPIQYIRRA